MLLEADREVGELCERRVERRAHDAVLVDVERFEEGLVEVTADLVCLAEVESVALAEQIESDLQAFREAVVVGASEFDQPLGFALFDADGVLPDLEVGGRQGFGEVGVDQTLTLFLEPVESSPLLLEDDRFAALLPCEFVGDDLTDGADDLAVEHDLSPVGHDVFFGPVGVQVGQVAAGALFDLAETEEVRVGAAAASAVGEAEAAAAASAEDRAFEVMVVTPGAVAGDPSSGEHVLDVLESGVVDERWVLAVVDDPAVDDLADVVGTGEHPVHLATSHRRGCAGGGRPGAHPATVEFFDEVGDRPITGGVGVEGPFDV